MEESILHKMVDADWRRALREQRDTLVADISGAVLTAALYRNGHISIVEWEFLQKGQEAGDINHKLLDMLSKKNRGAFVCFANTLREHSANFHQIKQNHYQKLMDKLQECIDRRTQKTADAREPLTGEESLLLCCVICKNLLTEPLLLSCLHSACKSCVDSARTQTPDSPGSLQLVCPSCHEITSEPQGGALKENLHIASRIAVRAESEEEIWCNVCLRNGFIEIAAESRCLKCQLFLCNPCIGDHAKFLQHHTVVDLQSYFASGKHQLAAAAALCRKHKSELTLVCLQCLGVKCIKCAKECIREKHTLSELDEDVPRTWDALQHLLQSLEISHCMPENYQHMMCGIESLKKKYLKVLEASKTCVLDLVWTSHEKMREAVEDYCGGLLTTLLGTKLLYDKVGYSMAYSRSLRDSNDTVSLIDQRDVLLSRLRQLLEQVATSQKSVQDTMVVVIEILWPDNAVEVIGQLLGVCREMAGPGMSLESMLQRVNDGGEQLLVVRKSEPAARDKIAELQTINNQLREELQKVKEWEQQKVEEAEREQEKVEQEEQEREQQKVEQEEREQQKVGEEGHEWCADEAKTPRKLEQESQQLQLDDAVLSHQMNLDEFESSLAVARPDLLLEDVEPSQPLGSRLRQEARSAAGSEDLCVAGSLAVARLSLSAAPPVVQSNEMNEENVGQLWLAASGQKQLLMNQQSEYAREETIVELKVSVLQLQEELVKEKEATKQLQEELMKEKEATEQLQEELMKVKEATEQLQEELMKEKKAAEQLQEELVKEKAAAPVLLQQLQEELVKEKAASGVQVQQLQEELVKEKAASGVQVQQLHEELAKQKAAAGLSLQELELVALVKGATLQNEHKVLPGQAKRLDENKHEAKMTEQQQRDFKMTAAHWEAGLNVLSPHRLSLADSLRYHRTRIMGQMADDVAVVNILYSRGILSHSQHKTIMVMRGRHQRVSALLGIVCQMGDRGVDIFIETLRETGQQHLVELLVGLPESHRDLSSSVDEPCSLRPTIRLNVISKGFQRIDFPELDGRSFGATLETPHSFRAPLRCYDVTVTSDGRTLLATRKGLREFDSRGRELSCLNAHCMYKCIAPFSDGRVLAGNASKTQIEILAFERSTLWKVVNLLDGKIWPFSLWIAADDSMVAAISGRKYFVYDKVGKILADKSMDYTVGGISVVEKSVVVAASEKSMDCYPVEAYEMNSGHLLWRYGSQKSVTCLSTDYCGHLYLLVSHSDSVLILSASDGEVLAEMTCSKPAPPLRLYIDKSFQFLAMLLDDSHTIVVFPALNAVWTPPHLKLN